MSKEREEKWIVHAKASRYIALGIRYGSDTKPNLKRICVASYRLEIYSDCIVYLDDIHNGKMLFIWEAVGEGMSRDDVAFCKLIACCNPVGSHVPIEELRRRIHKGNEIFAIRYRTHTCVLLFSSNGRLRLLRWVFVRNTQSWDCLASSGILWSCSSVAHWFFHQNSELHNEPVSR